MGLKRLDSKRTLSVNAPSQYLLRRINLQTYCMHTLWPCPPRHELLLITTVTLQMLIRFSRPVDHSCSDEHKQIFFSPTFFALEFFQPPLGCFGWEFCKVKMPQENSESFRFLEIVDQNEVWKNTINCNVLLFGVCFFFCFSLQSSVYL